MNVVNPLNLKQIKKQIPRNSNLLIERTEGTSSEFGIQRFVPLSPVASSPDLTLAHHYFIIIVTVLTVVLRVRFRAEDLLC